MSFQQQLAPSGTLRVAINLGNGVLTGGEKEGNNPTGIAMEVAKKFAREMNLPMITVSYLSAGDVVDAVRRDEWDLALIATDPGRAEIITFSDPYITIEGSYLVPKESAIQSNDDVDKDGVEIALCKGSAYDLFLSRHLKHATRRHAPTNPEVEDLFFTKNLHVMAGVRQPLEEFAASRDDVRVLPEPFMTIGQTIAIPRGRVDNHDIIQKFVNRLITEGTVAELIKQFNKPQASVPKL